MIQEGRSHILTYSQLDVGRGRQIRDRSSGGKALSNLGVAYGNLSNYSKAIEYAQQSLAIAREIRDRLGEGGVLIHACERAENTNY